MKDYVLAYKEVRLGIPYIHGSLLPNPSPPSPLASFGVFIPSFCHPERSEGSRVHKEVDVTEILPPYGRLDDNDGKCQNLPFHRKVNRVKGWGAKCYVYMRAGKSDL